MKIKNNLIYIKSFLKTKTYVISLFLILILSFIFVAMPIYTYSDILEAYYHNSVNSWFIFVLIIIGLINSTKIYNEVIKNYNYLGRFKNKKDAFKTFIFIVIIINTSLWLTAYIFPLIMLILMGRLPLINNMFEYYNVRYYIYIIFSIIKSITLLNVIIVLYLILSSIIGKLSLIPLAYCLLDLTLLPLVYDGIIDSLLKMKIRIVYYFIPVYYSSFIVEIFISLFYISILILIYNILLFCYKKLKKDII